MKNIYDDLNDDLNFLKKIVLDNILFSQIEKSNIHGFGLFSNKNIHKDTIIGILNGQVIDWNEYDSISKILEDKLNIAKNYIFMEWNALNENTLLVRPFRTKYSFINHSYTPNLEIKYNPIRVVTIKNISKKEEFTLDYLKEPLRKEYLEGHGKTYL